MWTSEVNGPSLAELSELDLPGPVLVDLLQDLLKLLFGRPEVMNGGIIIMMTQIKILMDPT